MPTASQTLLARRPQIINWGRKLGAFFLGQGAVQLMSLLTGFLVIRWLSVDAYAQYSVAFSFQSSVGTLVDLGFSGAIIALVGPRVEEPKVVGRYIRSVLHYRTLLFLVATPIAAAVFIWMTGRQGWSWPARAALFSSVMFSLFFQGWTSCYSAPLAMRHRFGPFYRAQFSSGALRLGAFSLLHLVSALSAAAAAWVNSLGLAVQGALYRRHCRELVDEPPQADPAANLEMRRYVAPLVPTTVFYAFESQITIFLITWFGRSQNIAEVAALGRLTQALVILMAFNGIIVNPLIARLPRRQLAAWYWLMVVGGVAVAAALWAVSIFLPGPLLWIVGKNYAHLHAEVPWAVAGWGVYYLVTLLWTMHSARKWVYWWHSGLQCAVLLAAQIGGVWLFDMSTTMGVLKFSLMAAAANLAVQAAAGVYGFCFDKTGDPEADPGPDAVTPWNEPEAPAVLPAGGSKMLDAAGNTLA
jgi:O-antigen/teichoic acid export membrane protein